MEEKTRQIGEVTFYVSPLPFSKARRVGLRLAKTLAPGIGATMEALAAVGGSVGDVDTASIGPALGTALDPVSDEDLEYFAEVFGGVTRFSTDGTAKPFLGKAEREILFRGNLVLFFQWLVFAVEANYSDFFGLLNAPASATKE